MKIVFDTNVTFQDWFLNSPNMSLLENYLKLTDSKLVIPKIIIEETINKYKEIIIKKNEALRGLNGMLPISKKTNISLNMEEIIIEYSSEFSRRLEELKVYQPAYNNISHVDIVARDLSRRRPFQVSGKGYRDSLLWENILNDIAKSDIKTFLITNNHQDFGGKDKISLHENLLEDLHNRGLPTDSVQKYNTLSDFLDKKIKPDLQTLNDAIPELMEGHFKDFDINIWFRENKDSFINSIEDSILNSVYELRDLEDPTVTYIEDPDEVKIQNVYELNIDQVYIEANSLVDINFDVFVFKTDYSLLSEKYDLQIWERDWNKHYMLTSTILKLPLELTLEFNIKNSSVDYFDVRVEEFFGFCKKCLEPILSDSAESCSSCGERFF